LRTDVSFKIAGEAGQGLQAIGHVLAKSLARGGLYVFANQDNESRIRGGHNFFQVRVSDKPVNAISNQIHLIVALDERGVLEHKGELVQNGVIMFDGEKIKIRDAGENLLSVPFERLANEKTGKNIMANSVAVGAMLSLVRYDFDILKVVLNDVFGAKGSDIVQQNIDAAKAGYDYAKAHPNSRFNYSVQSNTRSSNRLLINGNEALASSALISGCKFMSSYPMSPSTPIQQFYASKMKEYNVVFEQAEDEVAAINMAIGASFTGVRSMVATSGGGFSLMVEGISLSGMTETPVVVVVCQRPGPATGFPTRTEQGELEFIIHAGHGEFPRVVFAPGTPEQAFYLTSKAFNLADRYQIPAFILSDQYLSDSYFTTERFDTSRITIDRGQFFKEWNPEVQGEYKRHLITDSGISPRLVPGGVGGFVTTDSDEHTEDGRITELAMVRIANVRKRLKKLELLRNEIEPPYMYGPTDAETILIGWGSTYGPIKEATEMLLDQGGKVRMMHFSEIWPFPAQPVIEELGKAKLKVCIESNATGQLARLIRTETGMEIDARILRFDGRPITPNHILQEFEEIR
jgi:2-oxoglutarate ferredoxin oxidoreductase subunit alpha